jgi:hypothetical protein
MVAVVVVGRRRLGKAVEEEEALRWRMAARAALGVRLRRVLEGRVVRMMEAMVVEVVDRLNWRNRRVQQQRLIEAEVEVGLRRGRHREVVAVEAVRLWRVSEVALGCVCLRMVVGRRIEWEQARRPEGPCRVVVVAVGQMVHPFGPGCLLEDD